MALYGREITPQLVLSLRTRLNEELPLPYHFDVVHYDMLDSPALKEHIDAHGQILYKRETGD